MESKYSNLLSIILVVAIIVVIAILGFFGYKIIVKDQTTKKAETAVAEFDENTSNSNSGSSSSNNESDASEENGETSGSLEDLLGDLGDSTNYMLTGSSNTDTYYEGYKMIGTISIPSIDIEYPILEENSSATLKIAIVAVYPKDPASAINQPGNLVLWGHNYKDGTFFSNISQLSTGAKIYIKDTTGTKIEYQVYNVYETTDSDMTYATRDTDGAREVTLSTCADTSGKRTIVWARET